MCAAQLNHRHTDSRACEHSYAFARSRACILFSESWPAKFLTSCSIRTLTHKQSFLLLPLSDPTVIYPNLLLPLRSFLFSVLYPRSLQMAFLLICPRKQGLSGLKDLDFLSFRPWESGTSGSPYPGNLIPQLLFISPFPFSEAEVFYCALIVTQIFNLVCCCLL